MKDPHDRPIHYHAPRSLYLGVLVIVVAAVGVIGVRIYRVASDLRSTPLATQPQELIPFRELVQPNESSILFLGDIMLDRGVEVVVDRHDTDYTFPFALSKDVTSAYDLTFANLEGPISDQGHDLGGKYSFRFQPQAVDGLLSAGIDVVSLANNHIWDYGRDALCDSPNVLAEAGISSVGAGCDAQIANQPFVTDLPNGKRLAILAYQNLYPRSLEAAAEKPGFSNFDVDQIITTIDDLKNFQGVDVVAVSMHWGYEYKTRSHQSQQTIAHQLVDGGADLIIGHHPHVAQEIERYQDGWIVYSMGNFIFDQSFSEETMKGVAAEVILTKDGDIMLNPLYYHLNDEFQPYFDNNYATESN